MIVGMNNFNNDSNRVLKLHINVVSLKLIGILIHLGLALSVFFNLGSYIVDIVISF